MSYIKEHVHVTDIEYVKENYYNYFQNGLKLVIRNGFI